MEAVANPAILVGPQQKGYDYRYGVNIPKGTHPIAAELLFFREKMAGRMKCDQGSILPYQHFLKVARTFWPEKDGYDEKTGKKIVYPAKFIWNEWNLRMLKYACAHNYLAIAGCSGFGKSEFAAVWAIINFLCDPANTLCILTSVTMGASRKKNVGQDHPVLEYL